MKLSKVLNRSAAALAFAVASSAALASSHMDAPLITLDPAANTTDVYAFVDQDGDDKNLVVALGVYPFEEPGIGPNKYNFDDEVLYQIHVALGQDMQRGQPTISYQFRFETTFQNEDTILQSYTGVVENVDIDNPDPAQNLVQTYRVIKVDRRSGRRQTLGTGIVPPNNQGRATPYYNQDDFGDLPAKEGVATETELDRYTAQSIVELDRGYVAFAGQRDDGFFGDILAIFDLLQLRDPGVDAQGGYNLHLMALEIPMEELSGDMQVAGVWATTSRRSETILRRNGDERSARTVQGPWVQIGRQGNPLFNEALVAIADKDAYSRTTPRRDDRLFGRYAREPELARLLNALVVPAVGLNPAVETNRSDLAGIYIPDIIKVDLSTDGVRLAGGGPNHPTNPDDEGFSRLSIFGNDVLVSQIQDPFGLGVVPGGWPNGRRFGDDVVDIAVTAVLSDLRPFPLDTSLIQVAGDNVNGNDMPYNKVFPYESTPQNGRVHGHHGDTP